MEQNNQSGAPVAPKIVKTKTSKTFIVGMAVCAAFAIAGAVFSGYALMKMTGDKTSNKTDNTVVTAPTETVNTISNEVAQNIIAPYIKSQTYLANIFDKDFNDDNKFAIAVQNLDPTNSGIYDDRLYYTEVDRSAKQLFGNTYELPKKDYNMAGWQFKIKDNNPGSPTFEGQLYGIGGMGLAMIDVVKDASLDGDNLIINVYHNVTPYCSYSDEELCLDQTNDGSSYYDLASQQADEAAYVEKYADQLPVYQMTFEQENGHYILKNVEKQ